MGRDVGEAATYSVGSLIADVDWDEVASMRLLERWGVKR